MLKKFYLFLFVWLFCITLTAQTKQINQTSQYDSHHTSKILSDSVQQEWVATYNGGFGNSNDRAIALAIDDSGNVYVTGSSAGDGSGYDYITIKYNNYGTTEWTARYNGPGNGEDKPSALVIDDSGNVYVTGHSLGLTSYMDYATIKYNSAGVEKWVARYNGPDNWDDEAAAMAIDKDGMIYVTGYSTDISSYKDFTTIKYNSQGTELWVKRFNGPDNSTDVATAIAVNNAGSIFVTGYTCCSSYYSLVEWGTIRYDTAGTQEWVKYYSGPHYYGGVPRTIAKDTSGNVYVTGYEIADIQDIIQYYDYATIKYNSAGTAIWIRTWNGPSNYSEDDATKIAVDNSQNVYVTGISYNNDFYYATMKYSQPGVQKWVDLYNIGYGYSGADIAIDNSGNIYVAGTSDNPITNYDYTIIKYNSLGTRLWTKLFNDTNNNDDYATSISVDSAGNIYVTGYINVAGTNNDYATVKYKQIPTVVKENAQIPLQFSLEQNYPNPFNPTTKIQFRIADFGFVSLKVYDVLGREVATLVNEFKHPGNYEVEFDGSKLTSGVYFYKFTSGRFSTVKKMILLK